ncbi:MAG: RnfABCDGE type electron transport complex subunit G [Alistipes sp.]|nr:RnfABCDGE type electron transport complex subunit G [Alistipes sp.]
MKSTLTNMLLVLFTITLLSSAMVGGVYMLTEKPIAEAREAAKQASLAAVLPAYDRAESWQMDAHGVQLTVNKAFSGDEVVGYAIETLSSKGYSGEVKLMVGFDTAGKILNISVLQQKETPGLGANMQREDNSLLRSFRSKQASDIKMAVRKDGGDVDALTAATISSRAYTEAVALAYEVYKVASGESSVVGDVATGASQQANGTKEGRQNGKQR